MIFWAIQNFHQTYTMGISEHSTIQVDTLAGVKLELCPVENMQVSIEY